MCHQDVCRTGRRLGLAVLAGLLNTTLHHEHGLLSMVALGLLLAAGGRPRVGAPPTAGRATAQSA